MDEPTPTPETTPLAKADGMFALGLGLTFALVILTSVGNFIKPGSIPSEPIWAFAAVVLGHKVSADKFLS